MDTSAHTMKNLFLQLGLDSSDKGIAYFMRSHKVRYNQRLDCAGFWTTSQADFLRESWEEDADWVCIIDQLDCQLRSAS